METVTTSQTSVISYQTQGATSRKTESLKRATLITWNLTKFYISRISATIARTSMPGPYYRTIGTVPRAYEGMKGRKNTNKEIKK
jgi:hypothetical protein